MNLYNWENSATAHRNKVKKSGTVVLHTDETVDTSFDRLQKEFPVERAQRRESSEATPETTSQRAPLMTSETATRLQEVMGFSGLLPCQAQCYRGIFNGRDIILHSRTGSGKTLAYALPLIERHLILESEPASSTTAGPFLLILVFSIDLAAQTKSVLTRLYPNLRIAVAGMDSLAGEGNTPAVLIGTVRSMDEVIRGKRIAAAANAAEERALASEERLLGNRGKRARGPAQSGESNLEKDADDAGVDEASDDEADSALINAEVSAAHVRAIVIDEVDCTLGPRFSSVGRRVRNMLKFIRHANGSLTDGLLSDFRAHHYVLCGATIPNWVIKAGFLGIKKYYYQLVAAGTQKLPDGLRCFEMTVPVSERTATAVKLLVDHKKTFGRVVLFGTHRQIERLEAALAPVKKLKVRSLTSTKPERERIATMEAFNAKQVNVLLCTDLAARGLDFAEVDTVLMLSLPHHTMAAETFVHRAGRTARVHHTGQCLLLHDQTEADVVEGVIKSTHVSFRRFADASVTGDDGNSETLFKLKVSNPLRYTRPNVKVPTAREVLNKQLQAPVLSALKNVKESEEGQVITFAVPTSSADAVKQQLWKYSLEEVPPKYGVKSGAVVK